MAEPSARKAGGGTVALWGAAAIVLLVGVVDFIATFAVQRPWTWHMEMFITASWWLAWLPLVPLIGEVSRRFPFERNRRAVSALGHAAAMIVLSLVHLSIVSTVNWEIVRFDRPYPGWVQVFARFLGVPFFVFDLATYGGLAAGIIAVSLARAAHANELIAERLRAQAKELEASVAHAKLDALRMQLNPHFLFNSLNAVSGLVVRGRARDAQEMLGRLGGLLRETLSTQSTPFVTVAAEVALLNDYLFIEQIRFGERLSFFVEVDDAALHADIPTMLLQPLVENAVRHGIEPMSSPGTVLVDVRRAANQLMVRIEDSGRGFPFVEGRLPREGIGLTNTRARLEQLFGDQASIELSNRDGGGASLVVLLPWRSPIQR